MEEPQVRMILTFLRVAKARICNSPLELEFGQRRFHLFPDGTALPVIAGADEPDPEPDPTPDPEPDPEPDPTPEPEPEPDPDPDPPEWGDLDKDRAERAVRNARKAEKAAKKKAEEAEARAKELEQAQETEQEKTVRERDEAKAEAERERENAKRLRIDLAIREEAAEAGVPNKRMKRVLRLIDREDISIEGDEVEGAAEAVEALLEEIPELKGEAKDPEPGEKPGGAPDRKRKPKELTAAEVQKMAAEDPDKFNQLWDEGKIPKSALSGASS